MKLVFASDSFKGTLTSCETSGLLTEAAAKVLGDVETVSIPMADGGEGTAESAAAACGGAMAEATVHDPLMREIKAEYALLPDDPERGRGAGCVIEMAAASGLTLLDDKSRDPLMTTSYGTGELMLDALDRGVRDLTIAIGGSATNDGGMGCLRALGVRFTDENGCELEGRGRDLTAVRSMDLSGLDSRLLGCAITVMCDVTNPLTGPDGATFVYGPQKGADEERLRILERGMCNYRNVLGRAFCKAGASGDMVRAAADAIDRTPGAGAAGGMGAALHSVLGAELRRGIDTVLDLTGFDSRIRGADLIITGEGRADRQSLMGKVVQGIGLRVMSLPSDHTAPVIAIVGSLGEGWEGLLSCGIRRVIPLADDEKGISIDYARTHAAEVYYDAAAELFRGLLLQQSVVE